jgi:hypothetical protein
MCYQQRVGATLLRFTTRRIMHAALQRGGRMKYTVEFEVQSELGNASETVYKALVSAFGSIYKIRVMPVREYVWYVQENQFLWHEVPNSQQ